MHVVCGHVFGTCVYVWCVHMCTLHVYCGVHTCVWCMYICVVCAHVYSVCILWCVRMCTCVYMEARINIWCQLPSLL